MRLLYSFNRSIPDYAAGRGLVDDLYSYHPENNNALPHPHPIASITILLHRQFPQDIQQARHNMIEQQIRTWEVLNQDVLDLLNEIYREEFVPEEYKELAFADTRIPLGHDQTMMTPKVEARLVQSLAIESNQSVLEIGTGSAYLTALLASSAQSVYSVDLFQDFVDSAQIKLDKAGLQNIRLECRDAYSLFDVNETFDIVVLTASIPEMDDRFLKLLNNDGRMFAIVGESPAMEARIISKQDESNWSYESLFETDLPALIGAKHKEAFEF